MAQTRRRAREEREAARRAEVAAAAARREKAQRRQELRDKIALPKSRRRRYGALPLRTVAQLTVAFFAVQVVVWFFFDSTGRRFTLAVLTLAVLLVLVTTRRSTPR